MALYPQAKQRPLPGAGGKRLILPSQIILHTAVAKASSLYDWFNNPAAKGVFSPPAMPWNEEIAH